MEYFRLPFFYRCLGSCKSPQRGNLKEKFECARHSRGLTNRVCICVKYIFKKVRRVILGPFSFTGLCDFKSALALNVENRENIWMRKAFTWLFI